MEPSAERLWCRLPSGRFLFAACLCAVQFICCLYISGNSSFILQYLGKLCPQDFGQDGPQNLGHDSQNLRQDRQLFIAILSAPKNRERRRKCRLAFVNAIRNGAWKGANVTFFIGHLPSLRSAQSTSVHAEQMRLEMDLAKERADFGDIIRLPLSEKYEHLPDKVIQILRTVIEHGWHWIVKLDDDMMPKMQNLVSFIQKHNSSEQFYVGGYIWEKPAYTSQMGAKGIFRTYAGGPAYMLSYGLAWTIMVEFEAYIGEFLTYGSSSEDVTMGHWVDYANERGHKVQIVRLDMNEAVRVLGEK